MSMRTSRIGQLQKMFGLMVAFVTTEQHPSPSHLRADKIDSDPGKLPSSKVSQLGEVRSHSHADFFEFPILNGS